MLATNVQGCEVPAFMCVHWAVTVHFERPKYKSSIELTTADGHYCERFFYSKRKLIQGLIQITVFNKEKGSNPNKA
jgi:hypothetical protein